METIIPTYTKEQLEGAQQANEERTKIVEEIQEIYKQREIEKKKNILSKKSTNTSKK